jgi:hypothetical protein
MAKREEAVSGSFVSGILEVDGIALQAGEGRMGQYTEYHTANGKRLTESCIIFLKVLSSGVPTTLMIALS